MTYPRFQLARAFKFFNRSSGSLTLNSTTWANLPTIGTTWDVTLPAQIGDVIEVGVSGVWNNENVIGILDVATIVSSSVVNYFSTAGSATGSGVESWVGDALLAYVRIGGSFWYTLVSGDISSGTVTLRLRYRTGSASDKTLFATADNPLQFRAKNLGPADPH